MIDGGLARAMAMFPVIGAGIGAIAGLSFAVFLPFLPPLVAAFAALLVMTLLTGALHEDGLADTADGLGARGDRDKRLEVMRDSRSGTYGVLALVFATGLKASALSAAPDEWTGLGALVAAGALSRAFIPMALQVMAPARPDGLGRMAGVPDASRAALAAVLGVVATLIGLGWAAPFAVLAGGALAALVVILARRTLGGYTGDVLGAVQQAGEIGVLMAAAGAWS